MKRSILIVVIGPTAVGKTSTSIKLAKQFNAEIISADSRQFYKEISIGTAKPSLEELTEIKHHFINNLSIQENYNASDFEKECLEFLDDYFKEKEVAVLCGGSGMYINAVINGFDDHVPTANLELRKELNKQLEKEGISGLQLKLKTLDPDCYNTIDIHNSKRVLRALEICLLTGQPNSLIKTGKKKERPFEVIKIGLEMDRKQLYDRINKRVDLMIEEGLLEEVKTVTQWAQQNALKTVGYKELFHYLNGETSLEFAIEKIKINSRRYAKRQLTWFKREADTKWFHPTQIDKISGYIRNLLNHS